MTSAGRNAFRVALVLLLTAIALGSALVAGYFTSAMQSGVEVSAFAIAVLGGVAAVSLWLSYTGRVTTGGLLLSVGLSLLFPIAASLIADVGVLLAFALTVIVAAIATLTLSGPAARFAILLGVGAAVLTLLLDLYFDTLAGWTRLSLPPFGEDVVLPIATAFVAVVLLALLASQFRRYALSTQVLLGFLLLALLPLALVSYLNNRQVQSDLVAAANRSLAAVARQTAARLDTFIQSNLTTVQMQGRLPSLHAYLALPREQRAGSALETQVLYVFGILQSGPPLSVSAEDTTPAVEAYYLLDEVGNLTLASANAIADADDFSGEVFLVPLATGQPYAAPIRFLPNVGATIFFSAPVVDKAGERVGVLVAQVDAGWLGRVVAASQLPATTSVALFDEYSMRLAESGELGSSSSGELWRFAQLPEAKVRAQLELAGRLPPRTAGELDAQLPDLAASLLAARNGEPAFFRGPVHYAEESEPTHLAAIVSLTTRPWQVLAAQHSSLALLPAREQTRNIVLIGLGIALAVAAVSALATNALTRPITQLTQVAQRVAGGDLAARAEAAPTGGELGALAHTFNTMTAQLQESLHTLEERVAERTAQLQATADISRATAGVRDLDELLELAVEMIRARFGFYHASVFLIDEAGEYAVLRESTGEIGAQLKAAGHRLAIGSRSLVGWVTQNRRLRIARDVADDPFHFKNPLLPETRSELCLPLLVGERLLGVLDVQSRELNAFDESDVQALQVLGDQLSVAIENAESFERTQAALTESRLRYEQTLAEQWRDVIGAGPREMAYELEPGLALSAPPAEVTDGTPVQIPLRLRERVIGAIELQGRSAGSLTEAEQAMIATIAAQLATALESAVLVQESQLREQRERLITEITDEIRATLNPAFILQSGIRQLGRAIGATEVVVKLQPGASEPRPPRGAR